MLISSDALPRIITGNIGDFREAGHWLDHYQPPAQSPAEPKEDHNYRVFRFAWRDAKQGASRLKALRRDDRQLWARRYLLLAWLLFDPDAGDVKPPITRFQAWAWDPDDLGLNKDEVTARILFEGMSGIDDKRRSFASRVTLDDEAQRLVSLALVTLGLSDAPDDKPGTPSEKLSARTRALGLLRDNPNWKNQRLADAVGVHVGTVKRWKEISNLRKLLKSRLGPRRGIKTAGGDVDAYSR